MQFVMLIVVGGGVLPSVFSRTGKSLVGRFFALLFVLGLPCSVSANLTNTGEEAALPASCLVPDAGAPSCGIESSPGSARFESELPLQVGNPINVVSGNKYQHETDYQSPASGLALVRHYNSSLSQYDVGMGAGWRHSYQVVLTRVGDDRLDLVQSDGRLISFYRVAADQADLFVASRPGDGHVQLGERSIWSLGDGRRMYFQGSFLVRMELAEPAGSLSLHYQNGKLDTVTDQHGESLRFSYVPGTISLPVYGSEQVAQPPGAIASVVLPSGEAIEYHYGKQAKLLGVQYPDASGIGYGYTNRDWPSHLTRRQSSVDGRLSEWRYDEQGQGVAWVEGGGINGLTIERDVSSTELDESVTQQGNRAKNARVTYADGRTTHFRWAEAQRGKGFSAHGQSVDMVCDNCLPVSSTGAPENSALRKVSHRSGLSSMGESVEALLAGLTRMPETSEQTPGRAQYSGLYPHSLGDITIQLTVDRLGKVKDLSIGDTSLTDILKAIYSRQLPACFSGSSPENPDTFSHDRIAALGQGATQCDLDMMVIVEFIQRVETSLKSGNDGRLSSPGDPEGKESSLPFWDPMSRYCGLPAGLSCEMLEDDLDMARLSLCSYGGMSCEPAYRLVSPSEVGMADDRFDNLGFNAQLYQDPEDPDRYILVFRGTDGVGDDWTANLDQARSLWSRQYDLALNLGRDVVDVLPGGQVEFSSSPYPCLSDAAERVSEIQE